MIYTREFADVGEMEMALEMVQQHVVNMTRITMKSEDTYSAFRELNSNLLFGHVCGFVHSSSIAVFQSMKMGAFTPKFWNLIPGCKSLGCLDGELL